MKLAHWFGVLAQHASHGMGHPISFAVAVLIIVVWACSGPFFGYNDTWQLVINTSTTIVTFLMVFLIQHTQNRDSAALHLKLDELLRAMKNARNSAIALEDLDECELLKLREEYRKLAEAGRRESQAASIAANR